MVAQMNMIVVPSPVSEDALAKRFQNGGFGVAHVPQEWLENPDERSARLSRMATDLARELRSGEKVDIQWVRQVSTAPPYHKMRDFFTSTNEGSR